MNSFAMEHMVPLGKSQYALFMYVGRTAYSIPKRKTNRRPHCVLLESWTVARYTSGEEE